MVLALVLGVPGDVPVYPFARTQIKKVPFKIAGIFNAVLAVVDTVVLHAVVVPYVTVLSGYIQHRYQRYGHTCT